MRAGISRDSSPDQVARKVAQAVDSDGGTTVLFRGPSGRRRALKVAHLLEGRYEVDVLGYPLPVDDATRLVVRPKGAPTAVGHWHGELVERF